MSSSYQFHGRVYEDLETLKGDIYQMLFTTPEYQQDAAREIIRRNLMKTTWGVDFINTARYLV